MVQHDDLKSHERTYGRVTALLKWSTLAIALLTALVVWLIA